MPGKDPQREESHGFSRAEDVKTAMPIDLGHDRDWLASMRDSEAALPFEDERARERGKRLHQHQIASELAERLPEAMRNELSDDDLLALGKRVFEAGGEQRWEELREERRVSAIEFAAETEGLRPADAVIVATIDGMIEDVGEEQIETWGQQMLASSRP